MSEGTQPSVWRQIWQGLVVAVGLFSSGSSRSGRHRSGTGSPSPGRPPSRRCAAAQDPEAAHKRQYTPVRMSAICPVMARAVLVAEDHRFYEHGGVDYVELRKALGYRRDSFDLHQRQGSSATSARAIAAERPRRRPRREHAHAAAREESLPLPVAQSAAQGEGGGHRVAARILARQGPHPRALPQHRRTR